MKKMKRAIGFIVIAMCAVALVLGAAMTAQAADSASDGNSKWTRLAGDTRYDTMQAVIYQAFPTTSGYWAVVACGENFPDALSASALASMRHCPIILTESDRLTPQAEAELERLGVENIYLMGGTGAINNAVEEEIRHLNTGIQITRVHGDTRRGTAVAAAREVGEASDTVIIVSGESYADALSIAPYSYYTKSPILLTKADGTLDDETLQCIRDNRYNRFVMVGGSAVIADSTEQQLIDMGLTERIRMSGRDRYETSYLVADFELGHGMNAVNPAVASGENFPDALSASPLQGRNKSILVLVKDEWSDGIEMLADESGQLEKGFIIGGEAVISQDLVEYIRSITENG